MTNLIQILFIILLSWVVKSALDPSIAILLIIFAIILFYNNCKQKCSDEDWLGNPLRFVIPVFTTLQISYWLWFGVLTPLRPRSQFDWLLPNFTSHEIALACNSYLISHLIFFMALDYGYNLVRYNSINTSLNISWRKLIILSWTVILVSILYALQMLKISNSAGSSVLFAYIGTIMMRIYPLIIALMSNIIIKEHSKVMKTKAIIVVIVSCALGLFIAKESGMRYLLFEQIIVIIFVFATLIKYSFKTMLTSILLLSLIFVLFSEMTAEKHKVDISLFNSNYSDVVNFTVDRLIDRCGSYSTDVLLLQGRVNRVITDDTSATLYRFFSGIPFAGLLFEKPLQEKQTSIDMLLYRTDSGNFDIDSSVFISGLTEISAAFGWLMMTIVAIICGVLHGYFIRLAKKYTLNYHWLVMIAIYAKLSFHGFNVLALLDTLKNIGFLSILVVILTVRKSNYNSVQLDVNR